MYCWIIATPFTDPPSWNESRERLLIHAGTDEDEAVRLAKEAAPHYRKVVAKANPSPRRRDTAATAPTCSRYRCPVPADHRGPRGPRRGCRHSP